MTHVIATVLMGLFLLAVALAIARGREWRQYSIVPARREGEHRPLIEGAVHNPAVWAAGFLLLALGVTALALAAVGGLAVPVPGGLAVVAAPFALLLLLYLLAGTYAAVRERQVSPAGATLASVLLLGLLVLAAITGKLVMG